MRVPGFARLYAGLLLGRTGSTMTYVALVLFVLQRYHSPQLAGATAFMAALPGIVVSPVAGALLDRYGRARLVTLDYALAAAALGSIAGLSALHQLPSPVLLAIVAVASLTNPLSWAGARSLFPILAPRHLWEHANGLDSSGHVLATLLASPVAGALVGLVGGEWALASAAAVYVAAAAIMLRLPDPPNKVPVSGSVLHNAWLGLKYMLRNPSLRGLALTLSTYNLGNGVLAIAVPVLVLGRLHSTPSVVGLLWGAMGGAGLASALVAGRFSSQGRERQLIIGGILIGTVATAMLPFANNLFVVAVAITLLGCSSGPTHDVARSGHARGGADHRLLRARHRPHLRAGEDHLHPPHPTPSPRVLLPGRRSDCGFDHPQAEPLRPAWPAPQPRRPASALCRARRRSTRCR
ncbi:MAG: MFS transporter [Chloroflexi bacterium]|nr:MAG: MFS transporter [Chloroflexota bacterium]